MTVILDFLDSTTPAAMVAAFNTAFGDYAMKMDDRDEAWLTNRMAKNAVDYSCSVGAFADSQLVGFSLTGLAPWRGVLTAFDAATGIIPRYRGQGLAARMFHHAMPRLKERGAQRFLLEVLQENEPAIKAYRRVGFRITRELDCYAWHPARTPGLARACRSVGEQGVEIGPVAKERTAELAGELDYHPSWEVSLDAVARIPDPVVSLGAFAGSELVGTVVYYPLLGWLVNLVVRRDWRRRGVGSALLGSLCPRLPEGADRVLLPNVERGQGGSADFFAACGLDLEVSQYEMALDLGK